MSNTYKETSRTNGLKKTNKTSDNKKKEEKSKALASIELVKEAKDGTTKGET